MSPWVESPRPAASGATAETRLASAVALYVREVVDIELTSRETLRLSRLVHTPADGYLLERHGDLIPPGTTGLRLEVGVYHFKSSYDVHLRIHQPGVVEVVTPLAQPDRTGAAVDPRGPDMRTDRPRAVAVHVCADAPSAADYPPVRSARDTLRRVTRLCSLLGIADQRHLAGQDATIDRARAAVGQAVRDVHPDGLLVLTFTGHSDRRRRDRAGEPIVQWCLHDGNIRLDDVWGLLGAVPPTAWVVVIADTCYAGAFAPRVDVPYTLVLLAACAAHQTTISGPTSEFVVRLEQLVCPDGVPNPLRISYRWLETQLQHDTPDAERPQVWTNRQEAWRHRPLAPPPVDPARPTQGHATRRIERR